MNFDIHVYVHTDSLAPAVADKLQKVLDQVSQLTTRINHMSDTVQAALDTLTTQVTNETTVNASAIALINGFPALIAAAVAAAQAAGATPAQLASFDALSTAITQNATDLGAAVTANTGSGGGPAPAASRGR